MHRHAAAVAEAVAENELVESAVQLSRTALKDAAAYPLEHYGWALLGGELSCTARCPAKADPVQQQFLCGGA